MRTLDIASPEVTKLAAAWLVVTTACADASPTADRPPVPSAIALSGTLPSADVAPRPDGTTASPSPQGPRVVFRNPPGRPSGSVRATARGGSALFAFGEHGLALTKRGAEPWVQLDPRHGGDILSAWADDSGLVLALARRPSEGASPGGSTILRSTDSGAHFDRRDLAGTPGGAELAHLLARGDLVLLVARDGSALESRDRGLTFRPRDPFQHLITAAHAASDGRWFLGTDSGRLLVDAESGGAFVERDTGAGLPVETIASRGATVVVGGGEYLGMGQSRGFVRLSIDGGATFRDVAGATAQVHAVCTTAQSIFATVGGHLLRARSQAPGAKVRLEEVTPTWPLHGLACSDDAAIAFANEGVWVTVSESQGQEAAPSLAIERPPFSDDLGAVWIRDARRAVVAGTALLSGADRLPGSQEYRGVTLVSDDAGVTWKRTVHSMLSLQTVCGWSDVVLAAGPEGAVSSRDGGQTFTPSKSVEVRGFTDCVFLSEREALGVDGGGVLRSDDGGTTWARALARPPSGHARLVDAGAGALWLIEDDRASTSTDGGKTWKDAPLATSPACSAAGEARLGQGACVRVRGGALEWSSGVGGAWEPLRSGASDLAAVAATAGLAIAVGTSGTILTLAP
jgi:hypothetical protein